MIPKSGVARHLNPELYDKCVECACRDLSRCLTRKSANECYIKWEAVRDSPAFKRAISDLKIKLKK